MPPVVARPTELTNAGFLWLSPIGTAEPTPAVTGSKFTDTIPVAWIPLGATSEGVTFNYSSTQEPVMTAEHFDPIAYYTTERSGNISFNLMNYTLSNFNRAMNGGVAALTSTGTTGSELSSVEPPTPGNEVRAMLLWQSTDDTIRLLLRRVIQGGEMSTSFAKAPATATIPFTFNMEIPLSGAAPWKMWSAGASRV